jgi:DNA helicase II / ATP-dependent DNA helicase PcrA
MTFGLNKYQQEAVHHKDGPCLVTSCPGSGKTFTLVERIVRLIQNGVRPKNILCLTFTNKAANEMRERVCKRLNIDKLDFFMGTFHSLCAKMIRKIGPTKGLKANFSIIDDRDQIDLIMQISRKLEISIEKGDGFKIANRLNFFRDQMEEFEWVENSLQSEPLIDIAKQYLKHCKKNSLLDFSALIYENIKLIESDEELKRKIQNTFKYIMVDETQDTNKSQFYLVNLLGGKWKNIMLIGDIDQCVVEHQNILMSDGKTLKIEDIEEGDEIKCAGGSKNTLATGKVKRVYKKKVDNYDIVQIKTVTGREVKFTKEHIVFADYTKESTAKIIVYLMYDSSLGYRIGVTNTRRKYGEHGMGVGARLGQERAECLWILKAVDSIDDGKYWEQFYSVKYGIPTWCFYNNKYRDLDYSQNSIKKLFREIDTSVNAKRLMHDTFLFEDRPHYIPKCMCKKKRRNFTINMCADSRGKISHRYMISGSDDSDRDALKKIGLNVRDAGKGKRGWRVDSVLREMKDINSILQKVRSIMSVNLIEKAKFSNVSLKMMPSSHLREGMKIFICNDDKIEMDEIKEVCFLKYSGNLYDIDVEEYHNFITNGIVSHNSIYGWRGARYQNIQDFMNNYSDCKVISLSKNYRSTPQIVSVASRLIKFNSSHIGTAFETDNKDGDKVKCFSFNDQYAEANWVGKTAKRFIEDGGWDPSDMAVLYRANKMSEPVEQALVNNAIPYEVIGAWNFYDRKEIRDCLAMLKLLANPSDGIAFGRVCSFVEGMGAITVGRIENIAQEQNIGIPQACKIIGEKANGIKISRACDKLYSIYHRKWDHTRPSSCLSQLIDKFNYDKHLLSKFNDTANERKDNVSQIVASAGECNGEENGVSKYLQQVSLITNADKDDKDDKMPLMSMHAAKGLEFPIVFMIGVEEDLLPHKNAISEDPYAGLEEERRLCYVGMTRAKKALLLSWCQRRRRFGRHGDVSFNRCRPSRFLCESGILRKGQDEN